MKKLLLFALLSCVPALGQAYSDTVLQNSPGNYGRPVPFGTVLVCSISDTGTPCTTKVSTFSDNTLGVACTQNAASGVLTGAPSSGTNCNNPGIADANGNFTIYVVPGEYRICTFAQNWQCENQSIGGSGGGIPFACASAVNGSIVGMTSPTTSSCDPNGITDFVGHWTSQSYRATGTFNGTVELTGGLADPTNPPDTNSVAFLAPLTVPTPFYLRPPSSVGAVGQCLGLLSQNIGTNGTIDALQWQSCLASALTLQTNGVNNSSQSLLNIVGNGTNCTTTNVSGGIVKVDCTGGASVPQALNPTAPTLTTNGTPGAASVTYLVQGCEDGATCAYHSAPTATTTIATANATLTSVNSINVKTYADTLYGYRCYNIYRTAGGPSQGKIATCVWKSFIDTGLAGDASTAPAGNTTVLDANGLTTPLPGCNKVPGSPYGIDGVPCTPNALDDEFPYTFGSPGDANSPFWTRVNFGTSTAVLTNGELIFTPQASATNVRGITETTPATPWSFVVPLWLNATTTTSTLNQLCGLVVYDGTKLETFGLHYQSSATNTWKIDLLQWTNVTTFSATAAQSLTAGSIFNGNWIYFKIQNDGTNLNYFYSYDGINYGTAFFTELKAAFLTNTNNIGIACQADAGSSPSLSVDYFRRVQ